MHSIVEKKKRRKEVETFQGFSWQDFPVARMFEYYDFVEISQFYNFSRTIKYIYISWGEKKINFFLIFILIRRKLISFIVKQNKRYLIRE